MTPHSGRWTEGERVAEMRDGGRRPENSERVRVCVCERERERERER